MLWIFVLLRHNVKHVCLSNYLWIGSRCPTFFSWPLGALYFHVPVRMYVCSTCVYTTSMYILHMYTYVYMYVTLCVYHYVHSIYSTLPIWNFLKFIMWNITNWFSYTGLKTENWRDRMNIFIFWSCMHEAKKSSRHFEKCGCRKCHFYFDKKKSEPHLVNFLY